MLTRGPLPSSVYWRRRLLALGVAVVLVVVIAKVLGHGGSGGDQAAMQAAQTGATTPAAPSPSTTTSTSTAPAGRSRSAVGGPTDPPTTPAVPTSSAPAVPTGACRPADVVVTPSVTSAVVGEPVTVDLEVQTRTEPACYWRLSALNLQVTIDSRGAQVWSTADCRQAITPQQLTLRSDEPTRTSLVWRGHVSDSECSGHTPWATRGAYSVTATALGGEPGSTTFRLGVPTVIVTLTPTPTGSPSGSSSASPSSSPSGSSSGSASSGNSSGAAKRAHASAGD